MCFKNNEMRNESDILEKAGGRDGMTVPEGFFESFADRMAATLPANPEAEGAVTLRPKTTWQRLRPYVYMAAMFAGIWCMLKMFTMMTPSAGVDLSIDNNKVLSSALSDEHFIYDYINDDISSREVWEEMFEDSIDVEEVIPEEPMLQESPASDAPGADTESVNE